jgi:hypothetical protein
LPDFCDKPSSVLLSKKETTDEQKTVHYQPICESTLG